MDGNEMDLVPQLKSALGPSNELVDDATHLDEDPLGYNPQLNCGYDPELRDDRRENKKKLRRRFEHIFDKYDRDFGGIGDEIDLKTGEIVIDNGHLQNMQNEQDIGGIESSDCIQISERHEEGGEASNNVDRCGKNELRHGSVLEKHLDVGNEARFVGFPGGAKYSATEVITDSATSPFDADESALEDESVNGENKIGISAVLSYAPTLHESSTLRPRSASLTSIGSDQTSVYSDSEITTNNNIFDQVPGLKESMHNVQSRYKQGQVMDQDAIQALGMSIANQLASFLSRPRKEKSKRKSKNSGDPSRTFPQLPEGQARKRGRRSPSPPIELTEAPSSGKKSIWAPIRHPRQQKRRRMKERDQIEVVEQSDNGSLYIPHEDDTDGEPTSNPQETPIRNCANCGSSDSDVWRKGPNGDLCNTCGMYLYRYGLMRPTTSLADAEGFRDFEDTEGEMDPLERDWFLACASAGSTTRKEITKAVGVKNARFIVEEDALIIQLKEIDLLSWERMAKYFPGRSAYALQCRYSKKLHGRAPEARRMLLEQGYQGDTDSNGVVVFSYTREPFKEEEDELLLKLRDEDALEWEAVAESLPGRAPDVIEQRYHELVNQLLDIDIDQPDGDQWQRPSSREGSVPVTRSLRYSPEEDAKIIELREIDKLSWEKVAEKMEGRNSFSLQKRYIRELCGRHPNSILPPRKAYNRATPTIETSQREGEYGDLGYERDCSSFEARSTPEAEYSAEEDALLLDLRNVQRLTWEQLDSRIPDRSRRSLMKRYAAIRGKPCHEWQLELDSDTLARPTLVSAMDGGLIEGENNNTLINVSAAQPQPTNSRKHIDHDFSPREVDITDTAESFTQYEDDLIVKLRELEALPWSQITMQLPGRTVSSISQRYHQYLCPRKVGSDQHGAEGSRTSMSPSPSATTAMVANDRKSAPAKRWTAEEDDILVRLREQGKSWSEIAEQLPSRTAGAVKAHHATTFDRTKKASQSRHTLPGSGVANSQSPLLRQAVNNLRRRSESTLSIEHGDDSSVDVTAERTAASYETVGSLPTQKLLHDYGESSKASKPKTQHQQNMRAHTAYSDAPETNTQQDNKNFRTVDGSAGFYPDTPFRQTQVVRSSSEPTPLVKAVYATPARYNPQAHPYFVAIPTVLPSPDNYREPEKVVTSELEAHEEADASKSQATNKAKVRKPRKRSDGDRGQKLSKFRKRSHCESEYEDSAKEKVDEGLPRDEFIVNEPPARHSSPMMGGRSTYMSPKKPERVVDDSENTASELEFDNEGTSVIAKRGNFTSHHVEGGKRKTSKVEQEEMFDTAYVKAHPEEVFHHRGRGRWARGLPAVDPARKAAVSTPGIKAKGAVANTEEANAQTDNERDELTNVTRATCSNLQAVTRALESVAPHPMAVSEIYEFLEQNFEYPKSDKSWREVIRSTLSRQPQFKKASAERKSGWMLSDMPTPGIPAPASDASGLKYLPLQKPSRGHSGSIRPTARTTAESDESDNDDMHSAPHVVSSDFSELQRESLERMAIQDQLDRQLLPDSSEISVDASGVLLSSSPNLMKRRSPRTTQDKVSTPGTGNSTLFSIDRLGPTNISTPLKVRSKANSRMVSVAERGNGKRIVHTALRDLDDSEDELAL